jgi:hypothetical protein
LLGWASRHPIIGSNVGIVTTNGIFRPFAMVNGRAVATWALTNGQVRLSPFATISKTADAALATDAEGVLGFLGQSA